MYQWNEGLDVIVQSNLITEKVQCMLHGTRQQLAKVSFGSLNLNGLDIPLSKQVICLGVVIDSELKFENT